MKKLFLASILVISSLSMSISISEIQGIEHKSKYVGKEVDNVVGVVTAVYNTKYNNGFFFESLKPDNDKRTSEGIWVSTKEKVNVGDVYKISGTVDEVQFNRYNPENLTITTINLKNKELLDRNVKVNPVVIDGKDIPKNVSDYNHKTLDIKNSAMDYFESLESMLVVVKDPLIVGSKEGHGEIVVVPDNGKYVTNKSNHNGVLYSYDNEQTQRIIIGDEILPLRNKERKFIDPNFTPNPGDKFLGDIEGVLTFSFGNYKIYNTKELPKIIDNGTKPDINKYKYNKDMLNVVSYNIENFNRKEKGRVQELAKQVVTVLQTPDILGLVEVEDDDGDKDSVITTASKNAKAIVKAIREKGGPQYAYIDIAPLRKQDGGKPGVNIRNVILYRTDRLKLKNENMGYSSISTTVDESKPYLKLTYNPGKIGIENEEFKSTRKSLVAHFDFNGKDVVAIVNHLQSKRSDMPIYGVNKPVRKSEINRVKQAQIVNNFVKKVLEKSPNTTVVVMGDMNDFEFSNTIKSLEGNELINTISQLPLEERHTYLHQGNTQVLDNILVNKKYKGKINIDPININSEFTESQGSFSDHDPIFIQFEVK